MQSKKVLPEGGFVANMATVSPELWSTLRETLATEYRVANHLHRTDPDSGRPLSCRRQINVESLEKEDPNRSDLANLVQQTLLGVRSHLSEFADGDAICPMPKGVVVTVPPGTEEEPLHRLGTTKAVTAIIPGQVGWIKIYKGTHEVDLEDMTMSEVSVSLPSKPETVFVRPGEILLMDSRLVIEIPGCCKASVADSYVVLGMTWPGVPDQMPAFVGGGLRVQRVFPKTDLAEEFGLDFSNAFGSESDS